MAHFMAMENPRIRADVVEVQEFPGLAQRYRVMGVPKTVINETTQFLGAVPEETFINKVLEAIGKGEELPEPDTPAPSTSL
ncbi:MAG: thioredoxin family protein [Chloroflexi bacterium]|nr:thioredoxin family protein [Chloroflexota bacterium]